MMYVLPSEFDYYVGISFGKICGEICGYIKEANTSIISHLHLSTKAYRDNSNSNNNNNNSPFDTMRKDRNNNN